MIVDIKGVPKKDDLLLKKERAGFFKRTVDSLDGREAYTIQYENYYVLYWRWDSRYRVDRWEPHSKLLFSDMQVRLAELNAMYDIDRKSRIFFDDEEVLQEFSDIRWTALSPYIGERYD